MLANIILSNADYTIHTAAMQYNTIFTFYNCTCTNVYSVTGAVIRNHIQYTDQKFWFEIEHILESETSATRVSVVFEYHTKNEIFNRLKL